MLRVRRGKRDFQKVKEMDLKIFYLEYSRKKLMRIFKKMLRVKRGKRDFQKVTVKEMDLKIFYL